MYPSIFANGQDDGWLLDGHWDAVPGLYPAGTFKYRPCSPDVHFRFEAAVTPEQRKAVSCDVMAKQVKGVCVEGDQGEDGQPAERVWTKEQFAQLRHAGMFNRIWYYVYGILGPDVQEREKNSAGASG